MAETPAEMFARVEAMADGIGPVLSTDSRAALRHVLGQAKAATSPVSHEPLVGEVVRLRDALRDISERANARVEFAQDPYDRREMRVIRDMAHAALAGGEGPTAEPSTTAHHRALEWGADGVTYRVGSGEPNPVVAWNVHLWFENGDSTRFPHGRAKARQAMTTGYFFLAWDESDPEAQRENDFLDAWDALDDEQEPPEDPTCPPDVAAMGRTPATCSATDGPVTCAREAGHPGFHINSGHVWGLSSKGYPMDPEAQLEIRPRLLTDDDADDPGFGRPR